MKRTSGDPSNQPVPSSCHARSDSTFLPHPRDRCVDVVRASKRSARTFGQRQGDRPSESPARPRPDTHRQRASAHGSRGHDAASVPGRARFGPGRRSDQTRRAAPVRVRRTRNVHPAQGHKPARTSRAGPLCLSCRAAQRSGLPVRASRGRHARTWPPTRGARPRRPPSNTIQRGSNAPHPGSSARGDKLRAHMTGFHTGVRNSVTPRFPTP